VVEEEHERKREREREREVEFWSLIFRVENEKGDGRDIEGRERRNFVNKKMCWEMNSALGSTNSALGSTVHLLGNRKF
jgi:hypothetical protein